MYQHGDHARTTYSNHGFTGDGSGGVVTTVPRPISEASLRSVHVLPRDWIDGLYACNHDRRSCKLARFHGDVDDKRLGAEEGQTKWDCLRAKGGGPQPV
ncbi:unnamed protein product [Protopolystoma xenopodis]|uniref:Uncharacterized protein n=1 Tax=Protopolystoma xenopodis TaxID=117903 RepID=A0A448WV24_9PLAT|nr:unnamed protein product [Protopolystoma xenopodis]